MNNKKNMKNVTVEEFLASIKGKQYKKINLDLKEIYSVINGSDIPNSFNLNNVEEIISYSDGTYVLNYGKGVPSITFEELKNNQ